MFQDNVCSNTAWLVRAVGICAWFFAAILTCVHGSDSPALALEEEAVFEKVRNCLNTNACVNSGTGSCGDNECKLNETNCRCEYVEAGDQCACKTF